MYIPLQYKNSCFKKKIISLGWNLIYSTTSLLPNVSFLSWAKWFHSTKMWRTSRIHWCMNGLNMTDTGTTQDNFILPALPVGGLPISQDRLDRRKLVRDRTIPIILPSGKNILVNMVFKISVVHTNLDTSKSKADVAAECVFSLPLMQIWLGT